MSLLEDFLTQLPQYSELSSREKEIFLEIFGYGRSRVEVTEALHISESSLSGYLTGIYKKFNIRGSGPVKENLLREYLTRRHTQDKSAEVVVITDEQQLQLIRQAAIDRVTKLSLRGKGLRKLLPEIQQLTHVTWLDLSQNQLTTLPAEIGQLTQLSTLFLSHNQLTRLPAEIGQLTNLTRLYTSENQLITLPAEMGQLAQLTTLVLRSNQLITLPAEMGQLAQLTTLDLKGNRLTTLPAEMRQLTQLSRLDLSRNQLGRLPAEVVQLTNLRYLNLTDNPIPLPPEILEKTHKPATISNYYRQLQAGQKQALNEAKMLLVGQGSVGKTSLVKRLIKDHYDPHERKTDGINIQSWSIRVNRQDIRLNVWDFGGQEIMHATHQFFLTKRSIYLLVVDARMGEEENRIEYWLKIIQSFSGDSPVIIVGNKVDEQPLDLDRRGLQTKYKNIKAIIETSCQTGQGLDNLRATIIKEVGELEHLHDQLALSWFAVKNKLAEMKKDFISYTQYKRMCRAQGIKDEASQRILIRFLHDLGIALNFQDDPRLEDTNILNPEWVTNGVYKILNNHELTI